MTDLTSDFKSTFMKLKIHPKAVLLGTLVDIAGTLVVGIIIAMIALGMYVSDGGDIDTFEGDIYSNTLLLLFAMTLGFGFTVLGGYIAGRIAGGSPLFNASLVGLAGIIIGLFFWGEGPLWSDIAGILLSIPAAYLGGMIAVKRKKAAETLAGNEHDTVESKPGRTRHSGMGVASFIISLLTAAGIILLLSIVVKMDPGTVSEDAERAVIFGALIILAMVIEIAALGLGIAGLLQKRRKRVFPVLGIACSAGVVFGMVFLIVAGLT